MGFYLKDKLSLAVKAPGKVNFEVTTDSHSALTNGGRANYGYNFFPPSFRVGNPGYNPYWRQEGEVE
ncbi:hypothetical protein ES708_32013 [subsurface metagenome]